MAVTIKRKSLKKTSKKNVRSRQRSNKTRRNMKTIRNMRGGKKPKPVYQYVEKKHLKEGLSNTYTKNYKKNKQYKQFRELIDTGIKTVYDKIQRKLTENEVKSFIQITKDNFSTPKNIISEFQKANPTIVPATIQRKNVVPRLSLKDSLAGLAQQKRAAEALEEERRSRSRSRSITRLPTRQPPQPPTPPTPQYNPYV